MLVRGDCMNQYLFGRSLRRGTDELSRTFTLLQSTHTRGINRKSVLVIPYDWIHTFHKGDDCVRFALKRQVLPSFFGSFGDFIHRRKNFLLRWVMIICEYGGKKMCVEKAWKRVDLRLFLFSFFFLLQMMVSVFYFNLPTANGLPVIVTSLIR